MTTSLPPRCRRLIGTPAALALLAGLTLGPGLQSAEAAVAGAWETFGTSTNAAAWRVYDWADDLEYPPFWAGTVAGDEHIYFTYAGDYSLSFFANSGVGSGAFSGDFSTQKISAVSCDVYIGDLSALEVVDCSVFATGPYGEDYYYHPGYAAADFSSGGWWSVKFSLGTPWYYDNGRTAVPVDPKTFTGIKEVNIDFYPKLGSAGGSRVGIDDLKLEPTVVAPKATPSWLTGQPGNFRLAFTPGPGLQCRVEKLRNPLTAGWDVVVTETGITGPAEHVFLRPAELSAEFFRVATEPFYTPVVSP